jgi:hypothetical protein
MHSPDEENINRSFGLLDFENQINADLIL